jgi:hypothetical protein
MEYDTEELETMTRFDLARHRRDEAFETLATAEREMANELERLFKMGNTLERIQILAGEPDKDAIKRLRKLADVHRPPDTDPHPSRNSSRDMAKSPRQANVEVLTPAPDEDNQPSRPARAGLAGGEPGLAAS